MKHLFIITAVLSISGCSSDNTPHYLNNKTLYDREGCAFIARHNVADTMFLSFSKEHSKETCSFVLEE